MYKQISKTCALIAAVALVGLTAGCATTGAGDDGTAVYVAQLQPMNTSVTGLATAGKVKLVVDDETLTAFIDVRNAPPGIVHWQHFHGFRNGSEAVCPSPGSDINGDGIVDLIETHPTSGKTMVPFIKDPASMNIAHGKYPTASAQGSYSYRETVDMDKLEAAFEEAFGGDLNLENRVVFIHGVPADTSLPLSVASLGPIPAQVTLPIACGAFERVD